MTTPKLDVFKGVLAIVNVREPFADDILQALID